MAVSAAVSLTAQQPPNNLTGGSQTSLSKDGVKDIADLLNKSLSFSPSSTLTGALQAAVPLTPNEVSTSPTSNAVLAGALNPAVNLPLSAQLHTSDFIDVSTPAPETNNTNNNNAATAATNTQANDNLSFSGSSGVNDTNAAGNSGTTDAGSSGGSSFGGSSSTPQTQDSSVLTGIYNSVGSASASTIRGTSVNVVT